MSKRPAPAIINTSQAAILEALREYGEPMTFKGIQEHAGLSRTAATRSMEGLRDGDLIDVVRAAQGRVPMLYTISRAGSRALARHKRKLAGELEDVVQPARNSLFEAPAYVPNSQAYFRNQGNKHIASRGFQC